MFKNTLRLMALVTIAAGICITAKAYAVTPLAFITGDAVTVEKIEAGIPVYKRNGLPPLGCTNFHSATGRTP